MCEEEVIMRKKVKKDRNMFRTELAMVKRLWPGQISRIQMGSLKALCHGYQFSV